MIFEWRKTESFVLKLGETKIQAKERFIILKRHFTKGYRAPEILEKSLVASKNFPRPVRQSLRASIILWKVWLRPSTASRRKLTWGTKGAGLVEAGRKTILKYEKKSRLSKKKSKIEQNRFKYFFLDYNKC